MSNKKHRPLREVQQEFTQQAAIAGQTAFQIEMLQWDVQKMNRHLKALSEEAKEAQDRESRAAAQKAKDESDNKVEAILANDSTETNPQPPEAA